MFVPPSRSPFRVPAVLFLAVSLALGGLLVTSPAQAQKIRPTFWGMHDNDWTTAPTVPVGAANFTTSRTYWPNIEKTEPTPPLLPGGPEEHHYTWDRLDAQVAAAEEINAQPMIVLGQTPDFHSSKPGSASPEDYMPADIQDWRQYVGAVAARYKTRLDYQIWPEPNISENWKGSPAQMAQLTVVAAKAIQQHAGTAAKVVSPALALRLKSQRTWAVNYFKQSIGGKRVHTYLDAIAIDPFPAQNGTPEDTFQIMRNIRKQLAGIGVRKPFWSNEINYGVAGGGETTTSSYPVSKQQSYVIRTFALSAAAGMQRTYWLGWFRKDTMAIRMGDGSETARSYETVRAWLNMTGFQGCQRLKSGLWVCTAKMGRREVRRIYWMPKGKTTIRTPRSTLRVENQSGAVNERNGSRRIRVTFQPIMVASKK